MNLIEQSVEQISKESFKNYYDREQAEEELMDMLQSNRLFKMKDTTLDFIKKLTGQSGNSLIFSKFINCFSNFFISINIIVSRQFKWK
jgi:ssDNA-binding replication factor A large subunit